MPNPKYPRYQDYVIKGGKLVGEFEQMYRDYEDPWHQSKEGWASDKAIAIHLLRKTGAKKVIELGCGLGHFTEKIASEGFAVLGIDVAPTAIEKAQRRYPARDFRVGELLDVHVYREFRPDAIVMAEITWYVLDMLDEFLKFLRTELRDTYLIHLLTTYPAGIQKYGTEKFTTLPQIMNYFGMEYLEWGELNEASSDTSRTFFLGRWPLPK